MNHFLKTILMAARNLLRGGRRTVSTLLAITVGLVGLTLLDGYITYSMNGLRETVIHSETGHVQVMRSAAFLDEGDSDPFPFMLDSAARRGKGASRPAAGQGRRACLSFTAIASAHGKTGTVRVTALATAESQRQHDQRRIVDGKDLAPGDQGRILLGKGVARKLGVGPGDAVSLFALSKGGGVNTQGYTVAGTTTTLIAAADNVSVSMDLADAQALLGTDAVPQLIVFLKKTADTARVAAALSAVPASSALHGPDGPHMGPAFPVLPAGQRRLPARPRRCAVHRPDRRTVLDLRNAFPRGAGAPAGNREPASVRHEATADPPDVPVRGPDPGHRRGGRRRHCRRGGLPVSSMRWAVFPCRPSPACPALCGSSSRLARERSCQTVCGSSLRPSWAPWSRGFFRPGRKIAELLRA